MKKQSGVGVGRNQNTKKKGINSLREDGVAATRPVGARGKKFTRKESSTLAGPEFGGSIRDEPVATRVRRR